LNVSLAAVALVAAPAPHALARDRNGVDVWGAFRNVKATTPQEIAAKNDMK